MFKSDQARAEYCHLYDNAIAQSSVPVEEVDVETSFGTTHVLTAGDPSRPPLIALHAMSMGATMWLPLLPALTPAHRVCMVDAVGDVSKSVARAVLSSAERVTEWIDEVLDKLDIERAAFVAASLGTWMATHYAMAHPERVERLALVGPAGIVSPQHPRWLLRAFVNGRIRPSREKIETFVDSLAMEQTRPRLRTDPWRPIVQQLIVGLATFRRNLREPRPVRCNIAPLAASGIPVLTIIGRNETLHDGETMADRFRRQLPDAEVHLVDNANHLIFIDQQDVVADLLQTFLG
ncbi:hypothetical protein BKN37_21950 [Mycobacterium talmoniae]|uniref:AB hydrolase-1 domain-containing protein n=2 Tax=Mycobacterium talmoniae TaxID=1858794 RepID=A0A1S1NBE2_9MYCO|nr:hypothetical protein BKN37_21950 [Mycobacterium talmoniae]